MEKNEEKAGAVAVRCRVRGEQAWWYRSPDSFDPSHNPHLIEHEYLYPTPPAVVSVEALEGLVEEWRDQAKMLRGEIRRPFGAVIGFMTACDADQAADELTTLIKERSNG